MVGWYVWYYNVCPYSIGFLFTVLELDYQLLCHVLYCSYQQAHRSHINRCLVVSVVYCIAFLLSLRDFEGRVARKQRFSKKAAE